MWKHTFSAGQLAATALYMALPLIFVLSVLPSQSAASTPPPSITSISPDPVPASNSSQWVTIYGTGFEQGASVSLTSLGQTFLMPSNRTQIDGSRKIQVYVDVTTQAAPWTAQVTNPDGQTSRLVPFSVSVPAQQASPQTTLAAPILSVVTTCSGTSPEIDLIWSSVSSADGYELYRTPEWGTGRSAYPVPTGELSFLNIANLVAGQIYTYEVAAEEGGTTGPQSNSVTATAPNCVLSPQTLPHIEGISPNPVAGSNQRQWITLYGSNFAPGATVTWTSSIPPTGPAYVAPYNTQFVSSGEIMVYVDVTTAASGWTFQVTNPDGEVSNTSDFSVTTSPTSSPPASQKTGTRHTKSGLWAFLTFVLVAAAALVSTIVLGRQTLAETAKRSQSAEPSSAQSPSRRVTSRRRRVVLVRSARLLLGVLGSIATIVGVLWEIIRSYWGH